MKSCTVMTPTQSAPEHRGSPGGKEGGEHLCLRQPKPAIRVAALASVVQAKEIRWRHGCRRSAPRHPFAPPPALLHNWYEQRLKDRRPRGVTFRTKTPRREVFGWGTNLRHGTTFEEVRGGRGRIADLKRCAYAAWGGCDGGPQVAKPRNSAIATLA